MAAKAKAAPKAAAAILCHEDAFQRGRKYIESKIAPRASKGELCEEDLSIPPTFLDDPVLKGIKYFRKEKESIESETETEGEIDDPGEETEPEEYVKPPSRLGHSDSESSLRSFPRKEVADISKAMKTQLKNAEKRKGMFVKQGSKIKVKVDKRNQLLDQIREMDKSMNDELRACRRYVADSRLFDPVFMYGSKFGTKAPKKDVVIMAELHPQLGKFADMALDEFKKFLDQVIKENTSTFAMGTFNSEVVNFFQPAYKEVEDPKKGLAAGVKWFTKALTTKACGDPNAEDPPIPNWINMLEKVFELGEPSAIYLACYDKPDNGEEVLEFLEGKGVPVHCVCFNPDCNVADEFFVDLSGETGTLMVDTSRRDMVKVDSMMQSVKTKKKALEKLLKKLEKLEDMQPNLDKTNELMEEQIAILEFVKNDLEICEAALAGSDLQRDEEGNLILPPGTPVPDA